MRVVGILLALILAGCTGAAEPHTLHGVFTTERTDTDLQDFQATVAPYVDGPVAIMESWPEQFAVTVEGQLRCEDLRSQLLPKGYLQTVSECLPVQAKA